MILVSNSPRRKELLTKAGYDFKVIPSHIAEDYPDFLSVEEIPEYLAEKKALSVQKRFPDELLIAADTIVVLDGKVIEKPTDEEEAFQMLSKLSGREHTVISGVCVLKGDKKVCFSDFTQVTFGVLTDDEIWFYIRNYPPFDKAGAYGAQDWIGLIGVERISGSYFNVMGLPIYKLYRVLKTM